MSHPRKTAFTNDLQSLTFLFVGYLYSSDWAALAQLVEHIIRNDGVRCSNHLGGTMAQLLNIIHLLMSRQADGRALGVDSQSWRRRQCMPPCHRAKVAGHRTDCLPIF